MDIIPKTIDELSILQHEIFHCVMFILDKIGIKLSYKTDEIYAYLIQYITKQFTLKYLLLLFLNRRRCFNGFYYSSFFTPFGFFYWDKLPSFCISANFSCFSHNNIFKFTLQIYFLSLYIQSEIVYL